MKWKNPVPTLLCMNMKAISIKYQNMFKTRLYLTTIVISFVLVLSACNKNIIARNEIKRYYYDCPIHRDYIAYSPGKCPKCGMDLQKWEMENNPRKSPGNSHGGHINSGGQN